MIGYDYIIFFKFVQMSFVLLFIRPCIWGSYYNWDYNPYTLLKSLYWLPVQSRIIFKLCSIVYQTLSSILHAFSITQAQSAPFAWFSQD